MKTCRINGCERVVLARSYCMGHYSRWKKGQPVEGKLINYPHSQYANKTCKKENCDLPYYAKDLCRTHHARTLYIPKTSSCKIKSCKRKSKDEYCTRHKARLDAGLSTDLRKRFTYRGEKHWSWKGGVAEYPNHSALKKTRKLKLESVNYECEEGCGKKATVTHHLDKSKDNHSFNNLKALCQKCHMSIYHKGEMGRKSSVPGFTLKELAGKVGCSSTIIRQYIKYKKESKSFQPKINQVLNEIICGSS